MNNNRAWVGGARDRKRKAAMVIYRKINFDHSNSEELETNIPSLECQVELMADITIGAAEVQNKL